MRTETLLALGLAGVAAYFLFTKTAGHQTPTDQPSGGSPAAAAGLVAPGGSNADAVNQAIAAMQAPAGVQGSTARPTFNGRLDITNEKYVAELLSQNPNNLIDATGNPAISTGRAGAALAAATGKNVITMVNPNLNAGSNSVLAGLKSGNISPSQNASMYKTALSGDYGTAAKAAAQAVSKKK